MTTQYKIKNCLWRILMSLWNDSTMFQSHPQFCSRVPLFTALSASIWSHHPHNSFSSPLEQKGKCSQYPLISLATQTPEGKNSSLFFLHKKGSGTESCCRYPMSHIYRDEYELARLMGREMLWLWPLLIPGYLFTHLLRSFYELPAGDWPVFRQQDNSELSC